MVKGNGKHVLKATVYYRACSNFVERFKAESVLYSCIGH